MSKIKQKDLESLVKEYSDLAHTLDQGFRQYFEDVHAIRESLDALSFTHDGKLKVVT